MRCYEKWLLDDEQKQMLTVYPGNMFILYAASYLCDIGLTDGEGSPPLAKDLKEDRTRAKVETIRFKPCVGRSESDAALAAECISAESTQNRVT